ncbi:helix-turn-helix domain-containing protein [Flavobacterium piscis]|uniref:Helix-turn-helix domain-containing protein n=1 Tax=Flavobacterium piscis TaxID=1114874 RepID=A0ABU1Y4H0_9FLAO|nr:hypothetical protein [Flavobacterium piscis]
MSYRVNLTKGELVNLKRIKHEAKDSKILRRHQCLHMLHTGMKRQNVAELLDIYIDTITDWVKTYQGNNRAEQSKKAWNRLGMFTPYSPNLNLIERL